MRDSSDKVIVFLPAYFAEKTLASVHKKIPKDCIDDIVLVDDGSKDRIQDVAKSLGIQFYRNDQNLGYGGNLKVCLQKAADLGGDILIELHPDDQYDPSAIPEALEKISQGYDFVMGSRFIRPGAARRNAMPLWKFVINRLSTLLARAVLGVKLSDFHCGFRVYRRRFLSAINFKGNDNDYLFSFQIIAQACFAGFKITEVPVECRYIPQATQINFKNSMRYGVGALRTLGAYVLAKAGKSHPLFTRRASSAAVSLAWTALLAH